MVTPPQDTNDPNFDPDVQPASTIQQGWCGHPYASKLFGDLAVCTMRGCGATWPAS